MKRPTGLGRGLSGLYRTLLRVSLDNPLVVVLIAVLFAGAAWFVFGTLREELTPPEDRSLLSIRVSAPATVSRQSISPSRATSPSARGGRRSSATNAGSGTTRQVPQGPPTARTPDREPTTITTTMPAARSISASNPWSCRLAADGAR